MSECDYVENSLIEPNIDDIYDSISFAVTSLKCAAEELKKMQDLINADEF